MAEDKKKELITLIDDEERRADEGEACQPFNSCGFNSRIRNNVSRPWFNYDRSSELLDCSATYSALILNTMVDGNERETADSGAEIPYL